MSLDKYKVSLLKLILSNNLNLYYLWCDPPTNKQE